MYLTAVRPFIPRQEHCTPCLSRQGRKPSPRLIASGESGAYLLLQEGALLTLTGFALAIAENSACNCQIRAKPEKPFNVSR